MKLRLSFLISFLFAIVFAGPAYASEGLRCASLFDDTQASHVYFGKDIQGPLANLIRSAQKTLDMELSLDIQGPLLPLIKEKADAGVQIRLLLDSRASNKDAKRREDWNQLLSLLKSWNISYVLSNTKDVSEFRQYPGVSLHRKLIIVDDASFYVGSSNLSRNTGNIEVGYFGKMQDQVSLRAVFENDYRASKEQWKENRFAIMKPSDLQKVVLVGPGTEVPDPQNFLIESIRNAKKRIVLSAYEASDKSILIALTEKKRTAPEVRIQVLLSSEPLSVYVGARRMQFPKNVAYKNQLLKAGIEVREFTAENQINHSRMAVFDDVVYGSSADFTARGFQGNIELGFYVKSSAMSKNTLESFDLIWSEGQQIQNVSLRHRLTASFLAFFERLSILIIKTRAFFTL